MQLNNLAVRWYNPEYFPTVVLLTISEAGSAAGITDQIGNNTYQNLDACDVAGNWSENFSISGGGETINLADNPPFPDVIRLTACVQNDDWNEFPDDPSPTVDGSGNNAVSLNSLGTQLLSIPYPFGGYGGYWWNQYTNCIDDGGEDCGDLLGFNQNNTGTMQFTNANVYLSVSHADINISGWTGATLNMEMSAGAPNMSYIGDNPDLEADYVLTADDITSADNGVSCLSILDGTKFGANGSYQAEFNVGDRVRIYGSKPEFNLDAQNISGQQLCLSQIFPDYTYVTTGFGTVTWGEGMSINTFFNGEGDYTDYMTSGGNNSFNLSMNDYGLPEDIDGQGFLSPFFINLWRASVSFDPYAFGVSTTSVTDNIMLSGDMFGSNSNPLDPSLGSIRYSDIYSLVDSRIKYVIFQNTLGMMYDNPDFNTSGQEDDFDYGIVPVATNNGGPNPGNIIARRHNKVHVYIVFRDEWVGEPITYGADDSRSTVNLDIDGRARMVDDTNDIIENL